MFCFIYKHSKRIPSGSGKFFQRLEYQTTLPASWEICMQVKKQQTTDWFQVRKGVCQGCILSPCLFNLYAEFPFSSVTQSCLTLCDLMDCSTPGLPSHHQLLELTQTHVHWVGDAIQASHPLSSPSPPAFNLSKQLTFEWVSSLHQVARVLEFQLQSTSCKMPDWMKHKLASRLLGIIPITWETQMTIFLWYKAKKT